MQSRHIKAIPTEYAGVLFRSRLEARYAMFFDQHRMGWEYEVQGFDVGGRWYLPDFWLPDCRSFAEIKGPLKDRCDLVKLAQDNIDAETGGFAELDHVLFVIADERGVVHVANRPADSAFWAKCANCRCWYPLIKFGALACRACGYNAGDATYSELIERADLPQMQWRPAA